MGRLAARMGVDPAYFALLQTALTHRSWCSEHAGHESNERLEFLGDAVLGLAVTTYLYERFPTLPEGELAKLRASVVNEASLAQFARSIELGDCLRLGRGEAASGGRDKPSLLSDAFEAVLGATYLATSFDHVADVTLALLSSAIDSASLQPGDRDYKTRLQEHTTRYLEVLPRYTVEGIGPEHAKQFTAEVHVRGQRWGAGTGRSKKSAEQAAAHAALASLELSGEPAGNAGGGLPGTPDPASQMPEPNREMPEPRDA